MSDSIKVAIKVRPLIKREKDDELLIQWGIQGNSIAPLDPEMKKRGEGFYFDHIFDMDQTNDDVFNVVAKPIVEAAVKGFNGTIFAYGQTSSGKTYTMMGEHDCPGVIPLTVDYIFDMIANTCGREFLLRVSYIEIYNERINDLLDKNGLDLKIKEVPKSGQAVVMCKEEVINCPETVLAIMKKGEKSRRTGETNMNERSSRSHTIFRITIESRESNSDGAVHVSQLNLVDLAGSERAAQTGATGERFNEGRHINLSLSSLGLVIMQLSEDNPQKFVNFRDSKLTRILQSSLGGNAMTTIICAVTPAALEETQCTLAFASRAKRIKNKPQVNEVLSDAALLKRYAKQLAKLKDELEKAKSADVVEMESKLIEKDRANQLLEERIELLKTRIVCGSSTPEKDQFIRRAKRRRTWGGAGTQTKIMPLQLPPGLPTIKEMEKTPEKMTTKERIKRRQSIIQSLDIVNQTFQTAFTDFELELIESERARVRLSDGSIGGDESCAVTVRPQRNVKFMDEVAICDASFRSIETTPERKNGEQDSMESPSTPKSVLRCRMNYLMESYDALIKDHRSLEEFTKLEKQLFVEEAVEKAMIERDETVATLRQSLTESEQARREIVEKYTTLQSHSSETDKRLAEVEQKLAESENSLRAVRGENTTQANILGKLNESNTYNTSEQITLDKTIEEDTSSVFANNTYFEDMNVSDTPFDSIITNDMETAANLSCCETNVSNDKKIVSKGEETKRSKELTNAAYSDFMRQIGEKSSEELARVMQELISVKLSLEDENMRFEATLGQKIREADEVKNDIRELKSGIEKLQETIHLLTNENTDLTSKLTSEKERACGSEKCLRSTIDELNLSIRAIVDERQMLGNSVKQLDEQVKILPESNTANEEEMRKTINEYKTLIDSLTVENNEMSTNLMSKIEELDQLRDEKAPPGDHECTYRELTNDLSTRNKVLENENIELSNDLMEKIEEYDRLKAEYESLESRLSSKPSHEESENLIEMSMNCTNLVDPEIFQNVELHRAPLNTNGQADTRMESFTKYEESQCTSPTVDDLLRLSIIPGEKIDDEKDRSSDKSVETWRSKAEMLHAQVEHLTLLNEKLSDLKLTSCKQCARLVELRDNRKTLKNEVKSLTRTLQELQTKFDRECADTEILRTKASEDFNLSVCDSTLNGSVMFEGGVNISFVEERVQSLHDELEAMRTNHDKLSALYKEKCEEIERLQDSSVRETTPTPLTTDSSKPRRNDEKLERIKTDIEALQKELRHFKKSITGVSAALHKFVNEKMSMQSEIQLLKNEKQAYEEKLAKVYNSSFEQDQIKSLENEVARLSSEVERSNRLIQELEEAKSSLETQVQILKSEKDVMEERSAETEISSKAQEKIEMLESEVARCIVEIENYNVLNKQLGDAKLLLEAQVQLMKIDKEDIEEKSSESKDFSSTQENIKLLEHEVARLSKEIDNSNRAKSQMETVKLSVEAEVQLLKTENEELTKQLFEREDLSLAQKRIESLETESGRLNAEIDNSNVVKKQLEDVKSSLEAEVQSLKSEKDGKTSLETETLSAALETIQSLEIEVARLKAEIQNSNIVKSQLEEAKLSFETEVRLLKTKKEACEEKSSESEDLLVFEQKIKSLEIEVARLGSEIQNLNVTKGQLEDTKLSLEDRIQSLQTENEALTQKLSMTETSSAAHERIEFLENELVRLSSDIEDFNVVKQQLDDAKSLLENGLDLSKAKRNIHDETIEELQRSLRNRDDDNETRKVTLEKLNSQKESIVDDSSISCKNVNLPNGNLESYEKIVQLLQSKLTDAIGEVEKYVEINAELNNRLAQIQITKTAERWSLDDEFTTMKAERSNMQQQLTESSKCTLGDSSTNATEYTKENTQFINKIEELERIEEASKNEKLALRSEITSLRAEVANLRDNLNNSSDRICEIENNSSSFTTEYETSKTAKISPTDAEFDETLHKTLKEYEKMVEELQEKVQSITRELKSNVKETIDLDNELTRLNAAKEELNDKRLALQMEVEDLRKEKNELHEPLTNLRVAVTELENKNALLVAELAAIDAKKEKLISSEISDNAESQCQNKYLEEELESAKKSITKELMSLKPASDSAELAKKSVSELFIHFVKTIMAKEKEVITDICKRFEREKQKLSENNKQSIDAEKRIAVWAKELESDLEITQQKLSVQEARNVELGEKIQKFENLLKESSHENQMLNEKMKVLEADFNMLQADLEKAPEVRQNTELNTAQEKERFIRDTVDTREMELSSKLRHTEKQYKVKLEELTSELEGHKSRNIDLTNNLEGLEANEKQLKNIVDMKTTELAKCNNALEILKNELDAMTKSYNQSSRYNTDKDRHIEQITSLLKVKCDKLSEYKTKLEFMMPDYENLKDQATERNLRLEKYKSEIECLTTESEKNISALKDQLDSEVIKTACYRKQLAELANKNSSLQMELVELRKKCEELEISNAKLAKSMRNSTSKIRAEEDMEDLRDVTRTLQRNLDGAGNRINELQDMKTRLMKDLGDLRVKYETTCNENEEMKSVLSSHRSSVADTIELREKYEMLLQEKNRIAMELEDKKSQLTQMQKRIEACEAEKETLIEKNKELDDEMDDIVGHINELKKENAELDDKLYEMTKKSADSESAKTSDQLVKIASLEKLVKKYEREITDLKSKLEKLVGEHEIVATTSKSLAIENTELRVKLSHLDRCDALSCSDSSRSSSPAFDSLQMDNKRRRSRNDLFNLNRPLHTFQNNEVTENCRCEALTQHISKIEKELALKNGKIATLELEMQSEIFPHMAKCKDLEELLAVSTKKTKLLKAKIKELEEARAVEMSSECEKCRQWRKNKRDQASQCLPQSAPLSMSGMSSGVIEQHVQIKKFEREKAALKDIVRKRHQKIFELKTYIKKLETQLGKDINTEIMDSSGQPTSSKLEAAPNSREAMKENIPVIWDNQRQPSLLRRNWFN